MCYLLNFEKKMNDNYVNNFTESYNYLKMK